MAKETKLKSRVMLLEQREKASPSERRHRVMIGNEPNELKVFSVMNDVPLYRVENNRIASEIDALRRDPKKAQILEDPFDEAAQKLIEAELLKLVAKANLERLIKASGVQEEPLLLTRDGVVVNGNRRLAILRKHNIGKGYVDVCLLPDGVSQDDIRLIEFRLQMDDPGKADYSWVNQLIAIRRATDAGIDIEKIRASMPSLSNADFNKLTNSLGVIDLFLDRRGTPGDYSDIGDNKFFFDELSKAVKKHKKFPDKVDTLLWTAVSYYDHQPDDPSEDRSFMKFKKAANQILRIQNHFGSFAPDTANSNDADDPLAGIAPAASVYTTLPTGAEMSEKIHQVVLSGEDSDARSKNAAQLHSDLELMSRKLLSAEVGSRTSNLTGILKQIEVITTELKRLRESVIELKKKSG